MLATAASVVGWHPAALPVPCESGTQARASEPARRALPLS
jgi:hypothetical protein